MAKRTKSTPKVNAIKDKKGADTKRRSKYSYDRDREENGFPKRLKELMEENSETMDYLAEKIGMQRQTISKYRTGVRKPDYEVIKRIANHYGVTTDYLIDMPGASKTNDIKIREICAYTLLNERIIKELHLHSENIKQSQIAEIDWENKIDNPNDDYYQDKNALLNDPPVIIQGKYECTFWDYLYDLQESETVVEFLNRFIRSNEFETIAHCMLDVGKNTLLSIEDEKITIKDTEQKAARYDMINALMDFCNSFERKPIETPRTKAFLEKYRTEQKRFIQKEG